jgi:hypothetical protein
MSQLENATQEKTKGKIENYNDAINLMVGWAESYEKLGAEGPAKEIRQMLDEILSSESNNAKALDNAIRYVDRLIEQKNDLKGRGISAVGFTYDKDKENWNETGMKSPEADIAVRDMLYQEKYRRLGITPEEGAKTKNNPEEENDDVGSKPTKEKSLGDYVDAAQNRIGEIYKMLGIEPKKEETEKEEAITENEIKTEQIPETAEKENSHEKYNIPTDEKLLWKYTRDNFSKLFADGTMESFKKEWTKDVPEHYKEYLKHSILAWAKNVPEGKTYIDNITSLKRGDDDNILQGIMALKDGFVTKIEDVGKMSFSKFVKKYLDLNVEEIDKNYFQHFSRRP